MAAIARLDAELAATVSPSAATTPTPHLVKRASYFAGGVLGGWLFGGAVAGTAGIPFCTAVGAVSGAYRAVTGRSLLDHLSQTAEPLPGAKASSLVVFGMPGAASAGAPAPMDCGAKGTKKCAG